jgi:uncharacterized protein (TIGR01319 family)
VPAALLIDFGSTYTKAVAVDIDDGRLLAAVQTPTTAATDIGVGLDRAVALARERSGLGLADFTVRRASSSAAGGLRMVAIGLVDSLTTEAASRAALGAGARLVRTFSHRLSRSELRDIEELRPDIVLLAGGTDGGDERSITGNARALATSPLTCPVVVAGNAKARDEVLDSLADAGKPAVATENVMPELNSLNVEPARAAIRDVFASRIVDAKGIAGARRFLDGGDVLPTPAAVLEAARLLAAELGDLVVVDVGGATTDVHSVGTGEPSDPSVLVQGLPQPVAMRTVEGDLGLRVNAPSILARANGMRCLPDDLQDALASDDLARWAERAQDSIDTTPTTPHEAAFDVALARAAVHIAVERHAGTVRTVYTPRGPRTVQEGKDLGRAATVIGTGGIFRGATGAAILAEAAASDRDPSSLRPRTPANRVDTRYALFAAGLLAAAAPDAALAVLNQSLLEVEQ